MVASEGAEVIESKDSERTAGWVALVGAGPGDPGLLTLRGRQLMRLADVILYDHLASAAVLATVTVPGQERIHVGKAAGRAYASQEAINGLIIKRALAGQKVVRLKGGDPYVFGRGGEEAAAVAAAGIEVEVVPGVSSFYAVPAAAGIPVTHRDHTSSVMVVTGHPRADGRFDPKSPGVDWRALAGLKSTLVILMGLKQCPFWSSELLAGGMDPQTPVAFVVSGTLPNQQVAITTLIDAPGVAAGLSSPVVAVVGSVVGLHEVLGQLRDRPLRGLVIGITRDSDDTEAYGELERLGAFIWHIPLTCKVPVADMGILVAKIASRAFDELVFTSSNGVAAFGKGLLAAGLDGRHLAGVRTWAVGPSTAAAMRDVLGLGADVVSARATAEGLVEEAAQRGVANKVFFFPAARGARRVLPDGLRGLGATVDELSCYETVADPSGPARLQSALDDGLGLLTVASPSAVEALGQALDQLGCARDLVPLAVIGPTTAAAATQAGMRVVVVPGTFHVAAMVEAIALWHRDRISSQ